MRGVRLSLTVALLVALLPSLTACAADKPAARTMVALTVTADGPVRVPGRVQVPVGEQVDFVVRAEQPGWLHIHSTPEQDVPFTAGTTTIPLVFDLPGVIVIETHDPEETIVQLEAR